MADINKKDKIKIYIVIGLSVVLLISGYFRLIHPRIKRGSSVIKPKGQALQNKASMASPAVKIPKNEPSTESLRAEISPNEQQNESPITDMLKIESQHEPPAELNAKEDFQSDIRDIFAGPVDVFAKDESQPEEQPKPPPPMKLKGTIVGGKKTIAIINDQFVRLRDWIGDYQIVKITKDRVFLRSEQQDIILEILKRSKLN